MDRIPDTIRGVQTKRCTKRASTVKYPSRNRLASLLDSARRFVPDFDFYLAFAVGSAFVILTYLVQR